MAILLLAVMLYILVSKYAEPGVGAKNQWRLLGIVFVVIVIEAMAQAASQSLIFGLTASIASALVLLALLIKWIGVPKPIAVKITLIFTAIRVAFGVALVFLLPGA